VAGTNAREASFFRRPRNQRFCISREMTVIREALLARPLPPTTYAPR
jgi:hypothetical protein